jgi:hypothetical protein
VATIAETWIKAGGSESGLHELMAIARRNCSNGRSYPTSTMAVQSCGCPVHAYVRSEPGLYRLAHTERNRDAYVSSEWDLWSREDDERVSAD